MPRTLTQRRAQRQHYREQAIAQAERAGVGDRCVLLLDDLDNPGHQACRGESPGGAGCLCRCHDRAAPDA